ncbi:MAG TPA: hypothetical protein DEQ03_11970 [Marinilabiliales bacterium]|jgi:hypothetical protein|nr:hypothetical protein [Marinilabiliales bacterium]
MIGTKAMNKLLTYIFLAVFAMVSACELETTDYPDTPQIEFKEIKVADTVDLLGSKSRLVNLHFYLIDGDGNIGPIYTIKDTLPNCYITLYYKNSTGIFTQDTNIIDTLSSYTIPDVGDLGQDKTLKADIFIDISYNTEPTMSHTHFFYSIQVIDKSLNKSNTIHTDTIIIQ